MLRSTVGYRHYRSGATVTGRRKLAKVDSAAYPDSCQRARCHEPREAARLAGSDPPNAARRGEPLQRVWPDGLADLPRDGRPSKLDTKEKTALMRSAVAAHTRGPHAQRMHWFNEACM
jgi:hypothetical protein